MTSIDRSSKSPSIFAELPSKNTSYNYIPNRFPLPSIGNATLQLSPSYGQDRIENQGVDDNDRLYYNVISSFQGHVIGKRRVFAEDILKFVSAADLETFECALDQYENSLQVFNSRRPNTNIAPSAVEVTFAASSLSTGEAVAIPSQDEPSRETSTTEPSATVSSAPPVADAPLKSKPGRPKEWKKTTSATSLAPLFASAQTISQAFEPLYTPEATNLEPLPAYRNLPSRPGRKPITGLTSSSARKPQQLISKQSHAGDSSRPSPSKKIKLALKSKTSSSPPLERPKSEIPPPAAIPTAEEYEVEAILSDRLINGARSYEVKWVGYEETSWENTENLAEASVLVGKYWVGKRKKQTAKGKVGEARLNAAEVALMTMGSDEDEDDDEIG